MSARRLALLLAYALSAASGAWAAPSNSPAPTPKPEALDKGDDPSSYGDLAELSLRRVSLTLDRAESHADMALVGALAMRSNDERFGGLSALVWEKGRGLTAVSDRGWWILGLPDRVEPLPGNRGVRIAPLLDTFSQPLRQVASDAEGAALDPNGDWLVSFEGDHRIWRYPALGGGALKVRGAPEWAALQSNSGLEAITVAADGTIFAIPERSGEETRPFPVWRRSDEMWETLYLPRSGDYLVTDAAIGPDGLLYVLERKLSLLGGFSMRIRRAAVAAARDGATLQVETMAELPVGSGVDNMEGMSFAPVSADAPPRGDGRSEARLLVVSDDNYKFFQRTLLLEYRLFYEAQTGETD